MKFYNKSTISSYPTPHKPISIENHNNNNNNNKNAIIP